MNHVRERTALPLQRSCNQDFANEKPPTGYQQSPSPERKESGPWFFYGANVHTLRIHGKKNACEKKKQSSDDIIPLQTVTLACVMSDIDLLGGPAVSIDGDCRPLLHKS